MITLKWAIIWTGGLPHLSGLPTCDPPPPCKQALRFDDISPRSLAVMTGRNIFHLARADLRNFRNLAEFLARFLHLAQMPFISAKLQISPSSWRDLDEISFISPRPQSHYKSRRVICEILAKSRVSRRDLRDITNLAEFSSRLTKSRRDVFHLGEISSRLTRSRRDLCHLGEISLISPRYRRDLCDNTNQYKSIQFTGTRVRLVKSSGVTDRTNTTTEFYPLSLCSSLGR